MKNLVTIFSAFILLAAACKKDHSSIVAKTTGDPMDSAYFFRFALHDTAYNFTESYCSSPDATESMISSWIANNNNVIDSNILAYGGASVNIRNINNLPFTMADILNLHGKTFYFDDLLSMPYVAFMYPERIGFATPWTWESQNTPDTSYNVRVSEVRLLSIDSFYTPPNTSLTVMRSYGITGTCRAQMSQHGGPGPFVVLAGNFHMQVTTQKN